MKKSKSQTILKTEIVNKSKAKTKSEYEKAGVNITAGNSVVKEIKKAVASTHTSAVLKNIGSFGGLFDLKEISKKYRNPVLVQSIDGVGTKLSVARMVGKYESVGEDIVNHCCDDILAMGARPLTFLDYVASEELNPKDVAGMVKGMAKACRENGVCLIGGETAEMPGTYAKGEHDIAGVITGVVERDEVITGEKIRKGDILLGLPSTGLHTNGYSLARRILFEKLKLTVKSKLPFGEIVGEALLKVHKSYCKDIFYLQKNGIKIKGIAHITGGGFIENIPRILPKNLTARIYKGSWSILPIFSYLQEKGKLSEEEAFRVFNMGIGLVVVVSKDEKGRIEELLANNEIFWIGDIIKGNGKVSLQ